jgi:hypothetical protein
VRVSLGPRQPVQPKPTAGIDGEERDSDASRHSGGCVALLLVGQLGQGRHDRQNHDIAD